MTTTRSELPAGTDMIPVGARGDLVDCRAALAVYQSIPATVFGVVWDGTDQAWAAIGAMLEICWNIDGHDIEHVHQPSARRYALDLGAGAADDWVDGNHVCAGPMGLLLATLLDRSEHSGPVLTVQTVDGATVPVNDGATVLMDPARHLYPCHPDVMATRYHRIGGV